MQKDWRKRAVPVPLLGFLIVVGLLNVTAAILAGIQKHGSAAPFVVLAMICFGACFILARAVRRPSEQNRTLG